MPDSPFIFETDSAAFEHQVLTRSHELPVLVDFWAGWCAPCKMLMPVLAKLAEQAEGRWLLAKVDADAEQQLAARYQVRSLPTVKLFRNGEVIDEFMGALPESQVRAFLDRHIERESDRQAAEALAHVAEGHIESGLAALRAALESDPDNPRIRLQWVQALVQTGQVDEAARAHAGLPLALAQEPAARRLGALIEFARIGQEAADAAYLEQRLADNPDDPRALHQLAAHRALAGEHASAMELLLQLLQRHPGYGDGAGKRGLLAAFELADDDQLASRYRRQMSALLH